MRLIVDAVRYETGRPVCASANARFVWRVLLWIERRFLARF